MLLGCGAVHRYILGLYWDSGKENGNYYNGLYWDYGVYIGVKGIIEQPFATMTGMSELCRFPAPACLVSRKA